MKITIEDEGKKYEYTVPKLFLGEGRKFMLMSGANPILYRTLEKIWYYRARGCNFCGYCCVLGENISKSENLPQKEMEGKIVCGFLEKERWGDLSAFDVHVDPAAPKERTLGSPLKENRNAEVYVCKNPEVPYTCMTGPFRRLDCKHQLIKGCTILYLKLKETKDGGSI